MHARWSKSATILGPQNKIDILGNVQADTTEQTGAKNKAHADEAILFLSAAPATQPAHTDSANDSPATPQFDLLKGKQIQTVSLRKNASVESTLLAADHSILRRAFIEGDRIDHDVPAQRLTVPGPGRMLLEEHTKGVVEKSPVGSQGTSAFSWVKSFTFDQSTHQAVIEGSVQIRHVSDAPGAQPTALAADQVTADFLPQSATAQAEQLQLKQLTATGHVLVRTSEKLIEARVVTYDPVTEILTAVGTPDDLVIVTDLKTGGEESFLNASMNTRTKQFSATDVSGHARR
jgi:hypothetical protein